MRILLTRTDRVGDLILSTPAIATVRRSFPDAHVTLACSPYNAVVVDRSPDVDEVVTYDAARETPRAFGARFHGVDLAVALAPRDVDHRIVAATGARKRVGYTYATRLVARVLLRRMLTDVVLSQADPAVAERRPERPVAHEVDQVLAVVEAAGARTVVRDLVLPVTAEDRAAVALPDGPLVVQLGQRWTAHGSTAESCVQLFRDLRELGRPLVATYGDEARSLGELVAAAGVADRCCGELAFHAWAGVFARAACVVTIDTGATHVASATGVPTVVLFEHRWFRLASQEWSPYRVPNAVLRKPPDESDASLRASRAAIVSAVASLL